jgi:hypothetical protein
VSAGPAGRKAHWEALRAVVLTAEPTCCVCDEAPATQVDHIRPQFKGGSDERSNLQTLCVPCHQAKSAREQAAEWARLRHLPMLTDRDLARRTVWRSAAWALIDVEHRCDRCTDTALAVCRRPLQASLQRELIDARDQGMLERVLRIRAETRAWAVRCPAHLPRAVPPTWTWEHLVHEALTDRWQSKNDIRWALAVRDPWLMRSGAERTVVQAAFAHQLNATVAYLATDGRAEAGPRVAPGKRHISPYRWRLP